MLFCSHNEVDLEPQISVGRDKKDWVVIRCTCCKKVIGKKYHLTKLIEKALEQQRRLRDKT